MNPRAFLVITYRRLDNAEHGFLLCRPVNSLHPVIAAPLNALRRPRRGSSTVNGARCRSTSAPL